MNTRFFLLLERLQKLDAKLRLAQAGSGTHPVEVAHLHARKSRLRDLLSRQYAPALAAYA